MSNKKLEKLQRKVKSQEIHRWLIHAAQNSLESSHITTIKEIANSKLLDKISKKENLFRKYLVHNKIKKINGKGLMLALILESKEIANKLITESIKEGLLLFWLLWEKKAVRISPPLNIKNKEIKIGCDIIIKVLNRI